MNQVEFIQETQEHIANVGRFMSYFVCILTKRAVRHDMSKIGNKIEHDTFSEFTPRLKQSTYGSDEYKQFLKDMGPGLKEHYANNQHHPEHHERGIKDMTLVDLVEMLCDWKASTMRHADGDLVRSINQNQTRFGYSDELKQILLNTIKYFNMEEK